MAFAPAESTSSLPALVVATLASAAVALAIAHLSRRGRWRLVDAPDAGYKQQRAPVAMAGAFCLLAATAGLVLSPPLDATWHRGPLVLGLLVALGVGLDDDRRKARGSGLAWPLKLLGQLAAAGCVALAGSPLSPWLTVAWLVLCMNAWNFLDNCNGIAAATAIGATVPVLGTFASPSVVVPCGAMLGFLPFNWPRARLYLGDGGSHGLGFLLGCASLELWCSSPAAALALHALALADLGQVIVVRAFLGLPPWRGDRRHLAHRFQRWLPVPAEAPCFLAAQALVSMMVASP